jgi:hypothetical protein
MSAHVAYLHGDPDHPNLEALASRLAVVREQMAELRQLDADLTMAIADLMTGQQQQAGPWRLERRKGSTRKGWDSEALFSELIRRSNWDPETGETLDDRQARNALCVAVRECIPLTRSLGWRAGALRANGIDPDEWCETTPGSWRVDVTRTEGTER